MIKNVFIEKEFKLDSAILGMGGTRSTHYLRKYYIDNGFILDSTKTTIAKLNKDTGKAIKRYWANPPLTHLDHDWVLTLNNIGTKTLYIFCIPANSIRKDKVNTRNMHGRILIDLEIAYENGSYVDRVSKIKYDQWLVRKVSY